jgi:putative phosphoesterase
LTVLVCLLSDTHGVLAEPVAELVRACDIAVHAGDIGGAGVLQALEPRSGRVIAVLGNNDVAGKWPVADRALLTDLPTEAELDLPGGLLRIEHGHRVNPVASRHARLRRRHPQARAILYGHSHRLSCDLETRPWVLNPGAAGYSRTFGGPSCLLLYAGSRSWRIEPHRFER